MPAPLFSHIITRSEPFEKEFISYNSNNEEVINKGPKTATKRTTTAGKRQGAGPSVCDNITELMFLKDHFTFQSMIF